DQVLRRWNLVVLQSFRLRVQSSNGSLALHREPDIAGWIERDAVWPWKRLTGHRKLFHLPSRQMDDANLAPTHLAEPDVALAVRNRRVRLRVHRRDVERFKSDVQALLVDRLGWKPVNRQFRVRTEIRFEVFGDHLHFVRLDIRKA